MVIIIIFEIKNPISLAFKDFQERQQGTNHVNHVFLDLY